MNPSETCFEQHSPLAGLLLVVTIADRDGPHRRLPLFRTFPFVLRAITITPVELSGACRSLPQKQRPSPLLGRVGFHIGIFEACSVFTHVMAHKTHWPPYGAFFLRCFSPFVAS